MDRERVVSSNIRSVGYDPDSRTREVEFASGSVYAYLNVPAHHHEKLMKASSKGRYLNHYIKDQYRYVQV